MESIPIEHMIIAVATAVAAGCGLLERWARQRHKEQRDDALLRHKEQIQVFQRMIDTAIRPLAARIDAVVRRQEAHERRDEERFREIGDELHDVRVLLEQQYGEPPARARRPPRGRQDHSRWSERRA